MVFAISIYSGQCYKFYKHYYNQPGAEWGKVAYDYEKQGGIESN